MEDHDNTDDTNSTIVPLRSLVVAALIVLTLGVLAVQPALAAETNPVCQDETGTLANMIEGFLQITTALGLIGLLVVWQADELADMFTIDPEDKGRLKQHKRGAMRSATILVLLGPLFTVAGGAMDLPIAQCVDLVPL